MIIRIKVIFLIVLGVSLIFSHSHKQIKIFDIDEVLLKILNNNRVHIDHSYLDSDNNLIFDASENDELILKSLEIDYKVLIEDLSAHYKSRLTSNYTREFGVGSMGGYYTFEEIVQNLDDLHTQYPDLVSEKFSIGQTVEGNEIWLIRVGKIINYATNPLFPSIQEPKVLYTGLHHAREPMSYMNLFYFINWLCENYQIDDDATKILNSRDLYFVPAVNPDGLIYNEQTDPLGGGFHRKNMRPVCNPGYSYYTQTFDYYNPGVDLNRNYSYQWGLDDEGSSSDECGWTYRGLNSFSEPETDAVRGLVESTDFKMAFNYHSYGNLLLHPFGYSYENQVPIDDLNFFKEIGSKMVKYNNYTLGAGPDILYPVNGEACDWMYGEHQIFAYTPEVGSYEDGFWPATERIVPLAEENLHPNKILAMYSGSVLEPVLSSTDGPFKQGLTYPLYLKIKNLGLSEFNYFNFLDFGGSVGNVLLSSSEVTIDSELIGMEFDVDARDEIDLGFVGSFTVPSNVEDGQIIEISALIDFNGEFNEYFFHNNSSMSIRAGNITDGISDDFEEESGWYVEGDALEGIWIRDIPTQIQVNGVNYMPSDDHTENGEFCFITGSEDFNGDRYNDVDGGQTILYSPLYDFSSHSKALVSYWKYYTNNLGDNPDSDFWRVQVTNDNWSTVYTIEQTQNSNIDWQLYELTIDQSSIGFSDQMQFRFIAEDLYGGSFVEAGIDDFSISLFNESVNLGDINQDQVVNVSDIILIVNYIVGSLVPDNNQFLLSDLNSDNELNIIDVILLVNFILS
ncbi:MAG: hypothetical protein CMG00_03455 [Candidatus Marinimicrobia bacterium]|nr:hypothetical protein [Candidatus Neomarinimicrobiota bacterium]